MDAAEHLEEVERWHASRVARLVGSEGWLTLTGLFWLHTGTNTVGSDPRADVHLPAGPPLMGTIDLDGSAPVARIDRSAGAAVDGRPAPNVIRLKTDRERAGPTIVRCGSVSFFVVDREARLAVRVRDSESPARQAFRGIERYPVDLRWRADARFEPHPDGATIRVPDVLGGAETYRNPGRLVFDMIGERFALEAFQEPDEDELLIVFGDATNRDETFAGGRYLYARSARDGRAVVEFNRAYNPPCAFTEFATCVLAIPENRVPVRIEAGEKRYGDH